MLLALPETIPDVHLTAKQKKEPYGLPVHVPWDDMPTNCIYKQQLLSFEPFCMDTIMLSRDAKYCGVSTRTYTDGLETVEGYLGWALLYKQTTLPLLSLGLYTQPHIFVHFIGFLWARGSQAGHIRSHTCMASKVLNFLQCQPTTTPTLVGYYQKVGGDTCMVAMQFVLVACQNQAY
jgi:hypothetical protein